VRRSRDIPTQYGSHEHLQENLLRRNSRGSVFDHTRPTNLSLLTYRSRVQRGKHFVGASLQTSRAPLERKKRFENAIRPTKGRKVRIRLLKSVSAIGQIQFSAVVRAIGRSNTHLNNLLLFTFENRAVVVPFCTIGERTPIRYLRRTPACYECPERTCHLHNVALNPVFEYSARLCSLEPALTFAGARYTEEHDQQQCTPKQYLVVTELIFTPPILRFFSRSRLIICMHVSLFDRPWRQTPRLQVN